jgi:hypothetical protein
MQEKLPMNKLKGNNLTGFEDMLVPGLKYNMTEEVIGDYRD